MSDELVFFVFLSLLRFFFLFSLSFSVDYRVFSVDYRVGYIESIQKLSKKSTHVCDCVDDIFGAFCWQQISKPTSTNNYFIKYIRTKNWLAYFKLNKCSWRTTRHTAISRERHIPNKWTAEKKSIALLPVFKLPMLCVELCVFFFSLTQFDSVFCAFCYCVSESFLFLHFDTAKAFIQSTNDLAREEDALGSVRIHREIPTTTNKE